MEGQQIHDWDDRYQHDSPPPWEDLEPHIEFCEFVLRHLDPLPPSLEVGSGLGHNAVYLAQQGLSLTASDVSPSAVQHIQSLARQHNLTLPTLVVDVTDAPHLEHTFSGVVDKGCFHSFFSQQSRAQFVKCIHQLLTDNGVWVSSIGSADQPDDPNDPWVKGTSNKSDRALAFQKECLSRRGLKRMSRPSQKPEQRQALVLKALLGGPEQPSGHRYQ